MEKIITECSKLTFKPLIHFSGFGEPLVYPEIQNTMQLCNERKMKWSLTTNGYFLEKYVKDLLSDNCYAINVSIHGTAVENDKITGINGSFDQVVQSIKTLEKVKVQCKKITPLVAINCVISDYNVTNLWKILDTFLKLPVNSINFQHLGFFENDIQEQSDSASCTIIREKNLYELMKFISFLESTNLPIRTSFHPKIRIKDIIGYYKDKNYQFNETCNFPWLAVFVMPNGSVHCCSQIIGNLRTNSLKALMNNKQAIKFREQVRKNIKIISSSCFRCSNRQYY